MGFISDYMYKAMNTANVDINIRYSLENTYKWRNNIRPSALKLKTPKGQIKYLFHPHLLAAAGYINNLEAEDLINKSALDIPGVFNCTIGTLFHAIFLPELERTLLADGISAKQEHLLISKKYSIEGQADLVVFDHDTKEMLLVDLKTTGVAIFNRSTKIPDEYQKQLVAYGLALEECYPDYKLVECVVLSICKIPGSSVPVLGTDPETGIEMYIKQRTPLLAEWSVDWNELKPKHLPYFESLHKLVIEYNKKIQKAVEGYDHWVLNNELYELKLKEFEEKFNG